MPKDINSGIIYKRRNPDQPKHAVMEYLSECGHEIMQSGCRLFGSQDRPSRVPSSDTQSVRDGRSHGPLAGPLWVSKVTSSH